MLPGSVHYMRHWGLMHYMCHRGRCTTCATGGQCTTCATRVSALHVPLGIGALHVPFLRKRRWSSALAAHTELGLSTQASRRKLHLTLTMFSCMSSKSPPHLSRCSLCLHPTTTPTLLCLPSSTYHLINLPLAKSH